VLRLYLAVFHDVLITLGLFSIFHFEISPDRNRSPFDFGWLFDE